MRYAQIYGQVAPISLHMLISASVVNYTYEVGNGSEELCRACVIALLSIQPFTAHCIVGMHSGTTDDMLGLLCWVLAV